MARILIVDDDAALREGLAETLADLGHGVLEAADGPGALALLEAGAAVDAVLLDLRMPGGMDGLEVLRRVRERPSPPPVAILTAYASAANTIEAMRLGAFDHLTKPVGREEVADLVGRMLRAAPPPAALPAAPEEEAETLIGASPAMRRVQKVIGLVADSDATVLVTGETGTGKELVARAIHEHGRRSGGPFVAVNCAAIPPDLLESELFGHAKGAFTGAAAERAGAFRDAARGTLFLDEIGDMPLAMQAKILRALQERTVQPVGGRPVRLDVRIVAATHRDLAAAARDGGFRQDLYYRLNVVPIHLPPLRERQDDILPLARHFLRRAVAGRRPPDLAADAQDLLLRHPWPGNVRELRNAMERVAVLCRAEAATAADLDFLAGAEPVPEEADGPGPADGGGPARGAADRPGAARGGRQPGGGRAAARHPPPAPLRQGAPLRPPRPRPVRRADTARRERRQRGRRRAGGREGVGRREGLARSLPWGCRTESLTTPPLVAARLDRAAYQPERDSPASGRCPGQAGARQESGGRSRKDDTRCASTPYGPCCWAAWSRPPPWRAARPRPRPPHPHRRPRRPHPGRSTTRPGCRPPRARSPATRSPRAATSTA